MIDVELLRGAGESEFKVGDRVIASCWIHRIHNEPGTIDAPINKRIYPTGHGDWAVVFDGRPGMAYGVDESDIQIHPTEDK